jgi:hypothetical protein
MKGSTRAAVAIGVGYMLGRRRKLRVATVMAVATAVGGTTLGGMILRRGTKYLSSTDAIGKLSPQIADVVDVVRGDLMSAGKAAAKAAVNNRVDTLTDSLHERAERLRNPAEQVRDAGGRVRDAGGRVRDLGRVFGDADEVEDDDYETDEVDETDGYADDEGEDYAEDEPEDLEDDEPDEAPARRGRSPVTRPPVTRAPVTRAGQAGRTSRGRR